MEATDYEQIKLYKAIGEYPPLCSSRSNFKKRAKNYSINLYGYLMREKKIVLKKSELNSVWLAFHRTHSGVIIFFFILRAYIHINFFCGISKKKKYFAAYIGIKMFLQRIWAQNFYLLWNWERCHMEENQRAILFLWGWTLGAKKNPQLCSMLPQKVFNLEGK